MAGCCRSDYDRFFSTRFARRLADSHRKRGLDKTARRIVGFLVDRGIDNATILGIGGGVGEIEIELLRAGASRAQVLELSSGYEQEGRRLANDAGVGGRLSWRVHDVAEAPRTVAPVDVVVMHRVVCCYPDYERLLAAAADRAGRALVFSYPPRNTASRTFYGCFNLVMRLKGSRFRGFAHPPDAMLAVLERRGLRRSYEYQSRIWRVAGLERS
jgi:hypothetical protein